MSATQQFAHQYLDAGYRITPIPAGKKGPNFRRWQYLKMQSDQVEGYFSSDENIGIILTGRLVDIDLDDPIAVALGKAYLPPTPMMSGREGQPPSHYWYKADAPMEYQKMGDFLEIRTKGEGSAGRQTVVEPSSTPDRQGSVVPVVWHRPTNLTPSSVDPRILIDACQKIAAGVTLVRAWPKSGNRHDTALAVAGVLARNDVDYEWAMDFITRCARLAGDEETFTDRDQAVRDTYANVAAGKDTTGLPTLAKLIGDEATKDLCAYLGIAGTRTLPVYMLDMDESRTDWQDILDDTDEVKLDALPGVMGEMFYWLQPFLVPQFMTTDFATIMGSSMLSACFPRAAMTGIGLNQFALCLAERSAGKNIGLNMIYNIMMEAFNDRPGLEPEQRIQPFTSGTIEGVYRMVEGEHRIVLMYHREAAGWLEYMGRQYMSGAKAQLCELYDRDDVSRSLSKEGSTGKKPHIVDISTATQAAFQKSATRDDLANGYLSRYMMCAPGSIKIKFDTGDHGEDTPEWQNLVKMLRSRINATSDIRSFKFVASGSRRTPALFDEYAKRLGMYDDRFVPNEAALEEETDPPPGRTMIHAKKLAGLLCLFDPETQLDGDVAWVADEHIDLAITIADRSRAYAMKVGNYLMATEDTRLIQRVENYLRKRPHPDTVRNIYKTLGQSRDDVERAIFALEADGIIERFRAEGVGKKVDRFAIKGKHREDG